MTVPTGYNTNIDFFATRYSQGGRKQPGPLALPHRSTDA